MSQSYEEARKKVFHYGTLTDQGFNSNIPIWNLYVDGSLCTTGSGAGIILNTPDGIDIEYALKFQFQASNNEAEYEALIVGLSLAHSLSAEQVVAHSDSQLVVNRVLNLYGAK